MMVTSQWPEEAGIMRTFGIEGQTPNGEIVRKSVQTTSRENAYDLAVKSYPDLINIKVL